MADIVADAGVYFTAYPVQAYAWCEFNYLCGVLPIKLDCMG
jgi:hypothetical protein